MVVAHFKKARSPTQPPAPAPLCRFWKCPSGAECKYRHALPPGYVLKSQMKELLEEEARNVRDVADVIEEERAKVGASSLSAHEPRSSL